GEARGRPLTVQKRDDAVLDFLRRRQDVLLVEAHQLLRLEVLQAYVVEDAPVVQDVPLEGRPDVAGETLLREEPAQVLPLVADRAVDEKGRVPGGLGNTDLRVLGGDQPLGRAEVRPATDKVRRYADHDLRRGARDDGIPRSKPGCQFGRRHAEQDAEL